MKALTLIETYFPTAKRMEYRYRIEDNGHILMAWHAERKMVAQPIYLKHTKHGYLRTADKDEAVGEVTKIVWSGGSESEFDNEGVLRDAEVTND